VSSKSLIQRVSNRILHLVARVAPGATTVRPFLHRLRGVKIGPRAWIGDGAYLDGEYPECIEIHENAGISIKTVLVAHTKGPGRIVLERDSFLGVGVIVCCAGGREIRIGEGAVVGAGCVITQSVPARTFVALDRPRHLARVNVLYTDATDANDFACNLEPILPRKYRRPEE
jgi:acetyltransferase-like isoleucine patch superfamily enzyme